MMPMQSIPYIDDGVVGMRKKFEVTTLKTKSNGKLYEQHET